MNTTTLPGDTELYIPPKQIPPRNQQEDDPAETEKGEDEKRDWPKKP